MVRLTHLQRGRKTQTKKDVFLGREATVATVSHRLGHLALGFTVGLGYIVYILADITHDEMGKPIEMEGRVRPDNDIKYINRVQPYYFTLVNIFGAEPETSQSPSLPRRRLPPTVEDDGDSYSPPHPPPQRGKLFL